MTTSDFADPGGSVGEIAIRMGSLGGQRVVEKAATGRGRSRLRRESAALEQLRSRGVVDLIEVRESESSTTIVTGYVGARTLADVTQLSPNEILRALRDTCRVVMDLHGRGWTHGDIKPEHVLLTARGGARLCSFGRARPLMTPVHDRDADNPATVDLDALIALVGTIASLPATGESRRERWRWRQMRRRLKRAVETVLDSGDGRASSAGASAATDCIEQLLAQITDAPPRPRIRPLLRRPVLSRPTGGLRPRRLASGWLPRLAADLRIPRGSSRRRRLAVLSVAVGGIALLGGFAASRPHGHRESATPVHDNAATERTKRSSSRSVTAPDADRDGIGQNGVPGPAPESGSLVASEGKIYRIGVAGDQVAVSDWNCDGTETAAVLRPRTGEVFVFDSWASEKGALSAKLLAVVPEATGFVARSECGPPQMQSLDGPYIQVPVPEP